MKRYEQQSVAPFAVAAAALATAVTIAVAVLVPSKLEQASEITLATGTSDVVAARFRVDVIGYRDGRAATAVDLTEARAMRIPPRS